MKDSTLLLIDGHSLAFRAFYALRAENFVTDGGQHTNAVSGFLTTLLKLVADYEPTHIAVAFDLPGGTFRTRMYGDYKGGRGETPAEFAGQIELIQQSLDAMGVRWLTVEDYEADDIVATLSARGEESGMRVYISSGDKDSFQLVDERCTVLYPMPRSETQVLDAEGVLNKTGVLPSNYRDLAALVGENADNIPGVPGVGPKTAAKWIAAYGGVEEILAHADEIKGKAGESLRAKAEQVRLNMTLNELVRDLPIVEDIEELRPIGVDRDALHALFDTLGFRNLRSRVLAEIPARGGGGADASEEAAEVSVSREPFAEWLARVEGPFGVVLVDPGALPSGGAVAVGAPGGKAWVRQWKDDAEALGAFLADPGRPKVFHGAKGAGHALRGIGVELDGVRRDTLLQAYLLHPDQRVYDLDDLVIRYLGRQIEGRKSQATLFDDVDSDDGAAAAAALVELAEAFDSELAERGEDGALLDLEMAVSRTLGGMEDAGIAVDEGLLEQLRQDFDGRVFAAARSAYDAIGREVNLSSPKQLQEVLFDQLGLPPTRKTKSGHTTNAAALADLAVSIAGREDDRALAGQQFLASLLEHRDAVKLCQSVIGLQRSVRDGRIHTTFQQTAAATGRLSSTDPNLQNIHARTAEGRSIRAAFVPGEGYESIMTADYSQIEMRLMAALSGDVELIEAFREGADLHTYVASRVYGVPEEKVTADDRSHIKAMSYGLAYGLSAYGLSKQLRISVAQAQALMDDYFSRFGRVRTYLDSLVQEARKEGYTQTILGRRRYLPDLNSTNRQAREAAERMALNAPIQGSAADIVKLAMVAVVDSMKGMRSRVLLQVHDELVLEIAPGEREAVEAIVRREMENAVELAVPLSVGIGVGSSWREAAH